MQAKRSLTNSLIAVITGAFLLGNGLNVFGTQYIAALYPRLTDNFALFYGGQYINGYFPGVHTGEYWRLVTVALTHAGFLHLASNMFCLWSFGPALENYFGKPRFAILFLGSLVAASAASVYFGPHNSYKVGASGAVFGLLGGLLVISKRVGLNYQSIVSTVVLNLVITFSVPQIDWRAHVGGLVAGAAITYLLMFSKRT
jgi:membrane associated rhomboid family serine protease